MDLVVALGISIGILIAAWVYVTVSMPDLGLIVWAGIVAWATFYAAGGGAGGLQKTIASNLAGNFWAAVALFVAASLGGDVLVLSLAFGVVAFIFCLQSKIPLLAFIPGAFLGAATWVGVDVAGAGADGGVVDMTDVMIPVSMVVGAVLGYVSEAVGKKIAGQ